MPLRQQLLTSLKQQCRTTDFWLHALLYSCMGIAFWPVTRWFVDTAQEQSRIFHALIVLATATVLLVRFGGVSIREPLELNPSARRSLVMTFGLLMLSLIAGQINAEHNALLRSLNFIYLPAYCWASHPWRCLSLAKAPSVWYSPSVARSVRASA